MKELRISIFAYDLLKQLASNGDLVRMLKEFGSNFGSNDKMDYHWAHMTDENLLLAKLKYPDAFKYVTIREDE